MLTALCWRFRQRGRTTYAIMPPDCSLCSGPVGLAGGWECGDAPCDAKRMILGGFTAIVERSAGGENGYTDGFIVPVPESKREAYRAMAEKAAAVFEDYGAVRVVEAWGDDVPDGQVTDFRRAVKAEEGETVVYSWFEYPDRATRDAANEKMMSDPRMAEMGANMPFDGKRMIVAGFAPIVQEGDA